MKTIFCGNVEFDSQSSDLELLFRRFGKVERVDMKTGFAFVFMDDERAAEDAIRKLNGTVFGRKGRQLHLEWAKQDQGIKRPGGTKGSANKKPSKTLFVINFDPNHTRTRDLEKHFEPYGRLLDIKIRKNFAFIEYEYQEDATKALDATNMSKFMDQVISVEYAVGSDNDIENGLNSDARGFSFVNVDNKRDAKDANIRLDRTEFGRQGQQLHLEWLKHDQDIRRPGGSRGSSTDKKPCKTLVVTNFDPNYTRTRDLEKHFEPYGRLLNIRIQKNHAFVQYEFQEDARKALDATNLRKFMDQDISVWYATHDDDDLKNVHNPDTRRRDRSPGRRNYDTQLRAEWPKQEQGILRPGGFRGSDHKKPSKTLFVIHFDPEYTRTRDLEKHFEPYGRLLNIKIRRNFAFVEYEFQEDATKALDATNKSNFMNEIISVEYAAHDEDDIRNGHNSDTRGRGSFGRRNYEQGRFPRVPIVGTRYSTARDEDGIRNGHNSDTRGRGSFGRRNYEQGRFPRVPILGTRQPLLFPSVQPNFHNYWQR